MMGIDLFRFDNLAIFVGIFVALFSFLIALYSFGFMKGRRAGIQLRYYIYISLTLAASLGAVFSNNLIAFMIFWGFLGFLLYLLIGLGEKEHASLTAKKAFIIIGGTDALMLLGMAIVWKTTGSLQMDSINIPLNTKAAALAYLCLAAGAFAKAGAMPFHTWVPDTAEDAPTPVAAFLLASLDKLLGIYFLARLSLELFAMNAAMNLFLMAIGSITIVAAVMMALIQHDFKRLLGYCAVSQVGYMVLGIGTGNPVGIAGGLFHMLNHAIYKSCLFLSAGAVEKESGTADLEKLGGLARFMPVTFMTFLIASLAISGIPPLNGFASKWMVYQGIIETAKDGGRLWVLWLVAAMFGSVLTLAGFMKLVHAIFLGQPAIGSRAADAKPRETNFTMWFPAAILAALCILFGVFAYQVPLRIFILPSLKSGVALTGVWDAPAATILLLAGILLGVVIYFAGGIFKTRETPGFVGGETLANIPEMRVSSVEFYDTIKDIGPMKAVYGKAEKGFFDIYEQGKAAVFGIGRFLQYLHNGVLPTYLVWTLLGMIFLFFFFAIGR